MRARRVLGRTLVIVFMFVGVWAFPLAHSLYALGCGCTPPAWLGTAAGLSKGSLGLANAAVWMAPFARRWRGGGGAGQGVSTSTSSSGADGSEEKLIAVEPRGGVEVH